LLSFPFHAPPAGGEGEKAFASGGAQGQRLAFVSILGSSRDPVLKTQPNLLLHLKANNRIDKKILLFQNVNEEGSFILHRKFV
jgi:hypothetical protein